MCVCVHVCESACVSMFVCVSSTEGDCIHMTVNSQSRSKCSKEHIFLNICPKNMKQKRSCLFLCIFFEKNICKIF